MCRPKRPVRTSADVTIDQTQTVCHVNVVQTVTSKCSSICKPCIQWTQADMTGQSVNEDGNFMVLCLKVTLYGYVGISLMAWSIGGHAEVDLAINYYCRIILAENVSSYCYLASWVRIQQLGTYNVKI